jgi:hypothetical protein
MKQILNSKDFIRTNMHMTVVYVFQLHFEKL